MGFGCTVPCAGAANPEATAAEGAADGKGWRGCAKQSCESKKEFAHHL
jgi:hypothetical protein